MVKMGLSDEVELGLGDDGLKKRFNSCGISRFSK